MDKRRSRLRLLVVVWLLVVTSVALFACGGLTGRKSYKELDFPGELEWREPEIHTFSLSNGVQFFLVEDHELPLIQVVVNVRAGEFMVPQGKEGLARLVADTMRNGGTDNYPPATLNRLLENKAARMDVSFDFISGSAGMDVLKKDFEDLLPVFVELLADPAFPEDKFMLAKQQLRTHIARRNDDQGDIAFREFRGAVYGQDSLYARVPQYRSVAAVTRGDLIEFHDRAFRGPNLMVALVGDFETEALRGRLRQAFSIFPADKAQPIELPQVRQRGEPKVNVVTKTDVNQSFILMGHEGGRRQNPDYAALQVMNKILSAGFSGRLFQTIRSKKGLAYAVFGQYGCNYYYPGMFFVALETRTDQTVRAVRAVKAELLRLQQEGVSIAELEQAKEQFFNSLVFRYDKPEEIVTRRMYYEYRGMDKDSFDKLVSEIKAVTVEDVERVAREYIRTDSMEILVVGEIEKIESGLKELGPPLQKIDISPGRR